MPTGYTADIAKGITFRQFAMDCARAFGACITLRDEPMGVAAIPEAFAVETKSYVAAIAAAESRLADLRSMTSAEAAAAASSDNAAKLDMHRKHQRERDELRSKYEAMLARVGAWEPPTDDHRELKRFMADQITKSIECDCYTLPEPKPVTVAEWLAREIAYAEWKADMNRRRMAEEVERVGKRNGWIAALRASLPSNDAREGGE